MSEKLERQKYITGNRRILFIFNEHSKCVIWRIAKFYRIYSEGTRSVFHVADISTLFSGIFSYNPTGGLSKCEHFLTTSLRRQKDQSEITKFLEKSSLTSYFQMITYHWD